MYLQTAYIRTKINDVRVCLSLRNEYAAGERIARLIAALGVESQTPDRLRRFEKNDFFSAARNESWATPGEPTRRLEFRAPKSHKSSPVLGHGRTI